MNPKEKMGLRGRMNPRKDGWTLDEKMGEIDGKDDGTQRMMMGKNRFEESWKLGMYDGYWMICEFGKLEQVRKWMEMVQ
jgi:hypothetical protein